MPSRFLQTLRRGIIAVVMVTPHSVFLTGCTSDEAVREATLRQLGIALRVYAHESTGDLYPPTTLNRHRFVPDPRALQTYLADTPEGKRLAGLLAGREGHPICYLGYLALDETAGLGILNELAAHGADGTREFAIRLDSQSEYGAGTRFREGIERFLITDVNQPVEPRPIGSLCPIAWEIPDRVGERAALVLYLEGNVEWRTYPGDFPMTQAFIERLCEVTGGSAPQLDSGQFDTPMLPAARDAMNGMSHWWEHWDVVACDTEPNVKVGKETGYRVILELFEKGQKASFQYEPIPDADWAVIVPEKRGSLKGPRLVRVSGDAALEKRRVEILLFPDADSLDPQEFTSADLPWTVAKASLSKPPVQVDLGLALGYRWFGQMSFHQQQRLRARISFSGGEDQYHLYVRTYHQTRKDIWADPFLSDVRGLGRSERVDALEMMKSHPAGFAQYMAAYLVQRELDGQPVAQTFMEARAVLCDARNPLERYSHGLSEEILSTARGVLAGHPDHEAVALAALECLLPRDTPGNYISDESKSIGQDLLHGLPRDLTSAILQHLANTLEEPNQAQACSALLNESP